MIEMTLGRKNRVQESMIPHMQNCMYTYRHRYVIRHG